MHTPKLHRCCPALARCCSALAVWGLCLGGGALTPLPVRAEETTDMLTLVTRRQAVHRDNDGRENFAMVQATVEWNPRQTAIIVCDMWDDHWCRGAARRVAELAGPMNRVLATARQRGVLIVHAPSSTVDFYADTPQRRRAIEAPFAKPPVPLSTDERWGTTWCWPDPDREPELPIDDSDMGCNCVAEKRRAAVAQGAEKCAIRDAWTRQIATLEIHPQDAISDQGQEVFNLLQERGIENVILVGVHLNMCVLGRPFGIRQLVHVGKNVVLMRDMTDTMYNSRMRPFVDHFAGTDLVVDHVERYWCPTATSVDLVGGSPFRFAEDRREQQTSDASR